MSTRDFLVEIGTEELPPKSLPALSQAFTDGVVAGLAAAGVKHGAVQPYAAPRRLAVLVKKVAERQPDQEIRRKGPPVSAAFDATGKPTRAATAFAESCGVAVAELGRVQEAKGEFLHYVGTKPGAETASLLAGLVQASLDRLPIAKRMRWGGGTAEFVRPVHWVVMLFGAEVVPATILGVEASDRTRGHRFMAPKEIRLTSPASYAKKLESAGSVIADFAARRERIRTGVHALAAEHGVEAIVADALLDEVTALVEWPVPLAGRFEERFLELPPEVLIATLQDHQRYFPTRECAAEGSAGPTRGLAADRLTSLFITVANLESRDPAQVRAGNERVVRPRLSDAAFFWDTDRRQPLAARREQLAAVTFQAQLGSYADKAARVGALAQRLAPLAGADAALAARAAELAKCDLLTGLVGEFPELQGTMGTYYARHDGEPADVAAAMGEQYLPRFAGDRLPATGVGTALALADKLDTIVGIFAIGQKPSGTKDPFALRRAALGVLRLVLEKRLDLDLPATIDAALAAARDDIERVAIANAEKAGKPRPAGVARLNPDPVAAEVYDYVMERLRAHYLEGADGITTEMFDSVLDRRPASPLDFDARLRALATFLQLPDAAALAAANRRIANILRKAVEANVAVDATTLRSELLQDGAERELHAALERVRPAAERMLDARDYASAMQRLATLRTAVDAFFDKVMVMADDPAVRANRLALLAGLRTLFLRVADLSRLPG
ncbi:MAG: glycine--tRNA ligase subunit beta [Steroidobacteraceae bacterium]|jgi:glycyl-tRNA synthetase beta chain|nr:glycine--tRNA ligase subunit beta [Steroidobacteraceae bacterium]